LNDLELLFLTSIVFGVRPTSCLLMKIFAFDGELEIPTDCFVPKMIVAQLESPINVTKVSRFVSAEGLNYISSKKVKKKDVGDFGFNRLGFV
jgi:hypothetical protein